VARNFIQAIELTSIDSATFTGNLQVLNPNGLDEACSIIRIINNSDRAITVSYDGVTEHDFVRAGSSLDLNLQTNSVPSGYISRMRQGTVISVAGLAGGTGLIYLAGYYNSV
jgi:hypothetical protein